MDQREIILVKFGVTVYSTTTASREDEVIYENWAWKITRSEIINVDS